MRTIQRNLLKLITLTLGLVLSQATLQSFDSYTILHNPVTNKQLLILSELADEKYLDPSNGSFIKQLAGKINELKKHHPIARVPFLIDSSESEQEKLRHPQNWSELSPDFQWLLSPTTALHNTFKLVSCESRKMASFILNFIRDEGLVFFTAEQLQRNDTTNITTYPGYAQWKNYMLKYINHGRFPVSFFFQAYENYFNQMEQWGNEYPLGSAQRRIFEENKRQVAGHRKQVAGIKSETNTKRFYLPPAACHLLPAILFSCYLFPASFLLATENITLDSVRVLEQSAGHFQLTANVANTTSETREVILRGQITFYDRAVPAGDVPVMILHKTVALVLKNGESRAIDMTLLNEGTWPKGSLRMEPSMRIRREREWNY